MLYIVGVAFSAIILVLGAIGIFSGNGNSSNSETSNDSIKITNIPKDSIKKMLTREEIVQKLIALSIIPAPENLSEGAMCYKMAMTPSRVEYICPVCGSKTIYKDNMAYYIDRELAKCRAASNAISQIEIRLDESEFCRKCSPKVKDPKLCVITKFAGDSTENKVCEISSDDLYAVAEFLNGKLKHRDQTDNETPLKDKINRIEYILGIKIETK